MLVCIDAYAVPANFLEIDVVNPMTSIAAGKKRYTEYEVLMRVSVRSEYQLLASTHEPRVIGVTSLHNNGDVGMWTHAARHECRPLRLSHSCGRLAIPFAHCSDNERRNNTLQQHISFIGFPFLLLFRK